MAKKALVEKAARKPKFKVRGYTRCQRCGRSRAVFRVFGSAASAYGRWHTAANFLA